MRSCRNRENRTVRKKSTDENEAHEACGQKGNEKMKENEIRQGRRFRNHISIILEQTGAVIAAVFVLIVTQLFQSIDELTESDLSFITSKGFLILIGVIPSGGQSDRAGACLGENVYIYRRKCHCDRKGQSQQKEKYDRHTEYF